MAVNLSKPDATSLHPVAGVTLGTAMAGVRKANRRDVTVVLLEPGAAVAGVFTANRFCAAPVQVCREHLARRLGGARHPRQHRQRQRRHRRRRPGPGPLDLRRAGRAPRLRAARRCCRSPPA